MDPAEEEIVTQNSKYQISRRRTDEFMFIRVSGRYSDEMLDDLRSRVFLYKANYAVDFTGMTNPTPALARELHDTADTFKTGGKRLVLINPPGALRTLLTMGGKKGTLEFVLSEDQLGVARPKVDDSAAHTLRELERIIKEFQTNRLWQFVDREGCWICPYCARIQEDLKLISPLAVTTKQVENVYKHVWQKCPDFKPSIRQLKTLKDLQDTLNRANQEKVVVSKRQMDKMESELVTLKGKTEELEASVLQASERQRRLLPPAAPEVPGAEIDIIYRPAAVVSGDFYDFVPLPKGKVAVLVGDVSGHGIEAGILMGMAKKVLAIRLQDIADPIEAVVRANSDVDKELGRVSFVTAFITIFDPATRGLTCIRAGHNPPLLFNLQREERCRQLKPNGLGLGIMSRPEFAPTLELMHLTVESGDILLLYTDGLVEQRDKEGEQFGIERTTQVLASTYGYSPKLILRDLASSLDSFSGNAVSEDDITAVCMRFK
jgi:serine phosphatase RsbU (regulator of sigma subunit)